MVNISKKACGDTFVPNMVMLTSLETCAPTQKDKRQGTQQWSAKENPSGLNNTGVSDSEGFSLVRTSSRSNMVELVPRSRLVDPDIRPTLRSHSELDDHLAENIAELSDNSAEVTTAHSRLRTNSRGASRFFLRRQRRSMVSPPPPPRRTPSPQQPQSPQPSPPTLGAVGETRSEAKNPQNPIIAQKPLKPVLKKFKHVNCYGAHVPLYTATPIDVRPKCTSVKRNNIAFQDSSTVGAGRVRYGRSWLISSTTAAENYCENNSLNVPKYADPNRPPTPPRRYSRRVAKNFRLQAEAAKECHINVENGDPGIKEAPVMERTAIETATPVTEHALTNESSTAAMSAQNEHEDAPSLQPSPSTSLFTNKIVKCKAIMVTAPTKYAMTRKVRTERADNQMPSCSDHVFIAEPVHQRAQLFFPSTSSTEASEDENNLPRSSGFRQRAEADENEDSETYDTASNDESEVVDQPIAESSNGTRPKSRQLPRSQKRSKANKSLASDDESPEKSENAAKDEQRSWISRLFGTGDKSSD